MRKSDTSELKVISANVDTDNVIALGNPEFSKANPRATTQVQDTQVDLLSLYREEKMGLKPVSTSVCATKFGKQNSTGLFELLL
jgi:hypothetical protein